MGWDEMKGRAAGCALVPQLLSSSVRVCVTSSPREAGASVLSFDMSAWRLTSSGWCEQQCHLPMRYHTSALSAQSEWDRRQTRGKHGVSMSQRHRTVLGWSAARR